MSENWELYTAGKKFTLPPALTAWTNSTSGWLPTQLFYTWTFICVNIQILKTQQGNLLVLPYFIRFYTLVYLKVHWFLLMSLYKFLFRCCKQLCQNWAEFNEEPLQQAMFCKVTVFLLLRGVLIVHCTVGEGAKKANWFTLKWIY